MSVILDVAQTIKQFVLRRSINEVALHVLGAPAHFDDVLLAGFLALAFGYVTPSRSYIQWQCYAASNHSCGYSPRITSMNMLFTEFPFKLRPIVAVTNSHKAT